MTMNDWRCRAALELEKLVDAAVVVGARQQDVYAPFLTRSDSFGSPTSETRIPPTTSASRSSEEPANNCPPRTKAE